jgi:hypothetical protein
MCFGCSATPGPLAPPQISDLLLEARDTLDGALADTERLIDFYY